LALSGTAMTITSGSNTLTCESSYIELANSSSGQKLHLTSSNLIIQNGSTYGVSIDGSSGTASFTNASGTTTSIADVSGTATISTGALVAVSASLSGGNFSTDSGGTTSIMGYNSLKIGNINVINSSGQFIGPGIVMTAYGITCAGINPYVSGTQYYGYTGSFVAGSNTITVNGGIITSI
jgi:hypothetical protein